MQCGGIAAAAGFYILLLKCFFGSDRIFAVIPRLVAMMMPPAALPMREQAAWGEHYLHFYLQLSSVVAYDTILTVPCLLPTGLANIAGDGPNARDAVLAAGVMQVAQYFCFWSKANVVVVALAEASRPHSWSPVVNAQLYLAHEQFGIVIRLNNSLLPFG